eukprot:CAMPEP_0172874938 /NCGR_PEP_ID=MMETSP1075-20121228/99934_1 /TAXON_ID=2916 /ORGANISM="Ceratium fusus, Strain PA161109" /LENGTH=73 /DNA_ID=CAMNT_0013725879 /DNA_START=33 /DNA_END=251 /DNA_ORIENTATION=-
MALRVCALTTRSHHAARGTVHFPRMQETASRTPEERQAMLEAKAPVFACDYTFGQGVATMQLICKIHFCAKLV